MAGHIQESSKKSILKSISGHEALIDEGNDDQPNTSSGSTTKK